MDAGRQEADRAGQKEKDDGMGRPELQPEERRTERHNIRFSPNEYEHVRQQADAAGLDVAEYLRRRALGYVVPRAPHRRGVEAGLLRELNSIGVNINQIARNLNAGRRQRLDVRGVMDELQDALRRLAVEEDLEEPDGDTGEIPGRDGPDKDRRR